MLERVNFRNGYFLKCFMNENLYVYTYISYAYICRYTHIDAFRVFLVYHLVIFGCVCGDGGLVIK